MNNPLPDSPRPAPRLIPLPTVKPRLTYVLLVTNIAVFVAQYLTDREMWFYLGAKINEFIVAGEWWRLITPMFLHIGLLHIAVNSYSLFIFGPQVEAVFGYRRFLAVYLVSGAAGVVLSFALSPTPSVGASGAIFGLVGAMLVYFFRHRRLFGELGRRRLVDIAMVAGINLLIGLSPGIDNWGHIGGLLGGAILAWLIGPIYRVDVEPITLTARVQDSNRFAGRSWLAVFAVTLALAAATSVIATLQR